MDEAARAAWWTHRRQPSQVSKDEIVERSVAHFRAADPDYGERVATAVADLRRQFAEAAASRRRS